MSITPVTHAPPTETSPVLHAVTPPAPEPPSEPDAMSLVTKHWQGIAKVGGALVAGTLAWQSLGARVEKLEDRQARMVAEVLDMKHESAQRFDELDRQREQHARDLALLNLRIDTLEKSQQRTEQNTVLLLERVGRSTR